LELELKGGGYEALYQLAAQFQKLAPLRISAESKAARGWHLRTGQTEPARAARLPKLRRNISVAEGFHKIIGGTLGHLIANIGPTLRGDPEGVHQMRIALRRCRAALKLFAPHLGDEPAGKFDDALRHLGRVFGKARDWDVFCLETLPAAMVKLPAELELAIPNRPNRPNRQDRQHADSSHGHGGP
jgi:inorganic triphosphatase YgiF